MRIAASSTVRSSGPENGTRIAARPGRDGQRAAGDAASDAEQDAERGSERHGEREQGESRPLTA